MDLGLSGRWALVCAASKGLGRGCAEALVGEGVHVVITARGEADLLATAAAAWQAPRPAGDQTIEVVEKWWSFSRAAGAPWNIALTALEHLLTERVAG